MNPFFFGSNERRLFGIYEPPIFGAAARRAVILCYPWGSEYLYAHRAMRQLAVKLSSEGCHTLRFDFFGTGDSGGEATKVDFEGLEFDLELAIEEMRDISGLSVTTIVGLRLGGSVAASVATKCPDAIDALVLWDPIVSGKEYLTQIGFDSNIDAPTKSVSCLLTKNMVSQLREFDLLPLMSHNLPPTFVLITEKVPSQSPLISAASKSPRQNVLVDFVSDASPWIESSIVTGRIPVAALNRVTAWLHEYR